ncbi:HAD-IA family hydrolase [Variovorax paradoxus]|nr:HAD-IA family hydrolase [Variovorax paradoxus]
MTQDLHAIDAIAFDLDGTLVDSAPDIRAALNAALEQAGLEHFDLDSVRAWIGDGPDALIAHALCQHGIAPGDALRARLRRDFDAATLAAPLQFGGVFQGIAELVDGLRRALPMVVVTNKPTPLARAVLGAAGLLPLLAGVHGADAATQRKPAPFLLLAAARQLGIAPERLLMVGDGPHDLLAAHAAGCPAALVAWGYGGRAAVAGIAAGSAPAWHVATPQQLLLTVLGARAIREEITND